MDKIDTCCPFCGKEIEKLSLKDTALYSHNKIFKKPDCDAYISFLGAPNIPERFSRRDGADEDKCPLCGGAVALTNTDAGDTFIKCLNYDCAATFYFGGLAFANEDGKPIYTADEALQKFKERKKL